jgi:hypothetical protein
MSDPKASQPIVLHMYNTPTVEKGKEGALKEAAGCMCECGSQSGAGGGQSRVRE